MDSALSKSLENFKRRAIATPTVETKKRETADSSKDAKKPKLSQSSSSSSAPKLDGNNLSSMSGTSQYNFGILAKIVKYMRQRHQRGETHSLTLEDILDETQQLTVRPKVKQWLATEALINNPKIEVVQEGIENKFLFKAPYKLKDKKTLLRLLKQQDLKGLGGVLLDDVQESLPNCEKALKSLQNEIIYITRPIDKKKVLFFNDRTANFNVDEEFQKQWRAVAVESMDDAKIEEYLEKQGIRSMQDHGIKKPVMPIKRKKANKRKNTKPRDNDHLADVLESYDDDK
ncbi:general transcription factor IIE subunit 2 [Neocloeon triangulifer]|uniref:general transcription factor IIE subunit 2 n=1 Tax=Neocloeon triangulifer TaxID=2078957 RepID=UPI00286F758C|nr:general transcription factor IIE subunit 2 [Neocloeon triangulifer]